MPSAALARRAGVDEGVEEQHDLGVALGAVLGDVQSIGTAAHPPVDPAQRVARPELPDAGELDPLTGRPGDV